MVKVAVLGAGINGLSSAVRIKETFTDIEVVVISDEFSPNTTGDGSGGLWYPYLCGDTPKQSLLKWGIETYKFYHQLWLEGGSNICLIPINYMDTESAERQRPEWAMHVFGYQVWNENQREYYSTLYNKPLKSGFTFSAFTAHSSSVLKYFWERFIRAGGKVIRTKITSLSDPVLKGYDVVVNCTGLGSRTIVPDDAVFAVRGQVSKVNAPWLCEVIMDENSASYIIPNAITCVTGGTHQDHNYSTAVDKADTESIIRRCSNMLPAIKHAPLIERWVGLRPCRSEVRLEAEQRDGKIFIHNYGHGGSGLTLFWGCAGDVLKLLEKKLMLNNKSKL